MRIRCSFSLHNLTDGHVAILDNDHGMSVTNDAEAVVEHLLAEYGPDRRIFYRDTQGDWDELKHDGKRFRNYGMLTDEERTKFNLR